MICRQDITRQAGKALACLPFKAVIMGLYIHKDGLKIIRVFEVSSVGSNQQGSPSL